MLSRDARIVRAVCALSLSCTAVLCILIHPQPAACAACSGLVLAIIAAWRLVPRIQQRPRFLNWMVAVAVLNGMLVCPELLLRARDFRYEAGIQFGYPRPGRFMYLQPDTALFWRRSPSDPNVNSMGFVGHEVRSPKPPHIFRILFFGDSVTEQGIPEVVQHLLNISHGRDSLRFECVSLATAGYSSYQGKRLVDQYGEILDPDAAVVLFGWNDHYHAYGSPDAKKAAQFLGMRAGGPLQVLRQEMRLIQAGSWAWDQLRGRMPEPLNQLRVSPEEYRENLAYMRSHLERNHMPVLFLTAPTSHYRLGVPEYLINMNFARDKVTSVALHRQYNNIVRTMARQDSTLLLDLESEFESLPSYELRALFSRDGIHLTLNGIAVVASRIEEAIATYLDSPHTE